MFRNLKLVAEDFSLRPSLCTMLSPSIMQGLKIFNPYAQYHRKMAKDPRNIYKNIQLFSEEFLPSSVPGNI